MSAWLEEPGEISPLGACVGIDDHELHSWVQCHSDVARKATCFLMPSSVNPKLHAALVDPSNEQLVGSHHLSGLVLLSE
eukprot:6473324-Amphidinium_carterae.1